MYCTYCGTKPKTVISSREYRSEWKPGNEPSYPVNDKKNGKRYELDGTKDRFKCPAVRERLLQALIRNLWKEMCSVLPFRWMRIEFGFSMTNKSTFKSAFERSYGKKMPETLDGKAFRRSDHHSERGT